jgi:hypothetical protein
MPNQKMCAACVERACDCTAIVFKRRPAASEFTQARAEAIPGNYCEPAAWKQIFHTMRTVADVLGGEVRKGTGIIHAPA